MALCHVSANRHNAGEGYVAIVNLSERSSILLSTWFTSMVSVECNHETNETEEKRNQKFRLQETQRDLLGG